MSKKCPQCNIYFDGHPNRKYCTIECRRKFYEEECSICHKIKMPGSKQNGIIVCAECFRKNKKEICVECGNDRPVHCRMEDGTSLCNQCYRENNKKICDKCKKLSVITINKNNMRLCCNCYKKKENCIKCGKLGVVGKRNSDGTSICDYCNRKDKKEICLQCNKLKMVHSRFDGNSICANCLRKHKKEKCYLCKENKSVSSRDNGKPVCDNCQRKRQIISCYICEKEKQRHRNINGNPICTNCSQFYKKSGYNLELTKEIIKNNKYFHHLIFEKEFKEIFDSEISFARLLIEGIILNNVENSFLRYDYFSKNRKIAVEINEPVHYDKKLFNSRYETKNKNFDDYVRDFKTKLLVANQNNFKVIIINIQYRMTAEELIKLYRDKLSEYLYLATTSN